MVKQYEDGDPEYEFMTPIEYLAVVLPVLLVVGSIIAAFCR